MADETTTADAVLPPAEMIIRLDPPLKDLAGDDVTSLDLREPTAGEMKSCDNLTGYAWMIAIVAQVTARPEKVISRVPVSTLNKAGAYLTGFIGAVR